MTESRDVLACLFDEFFQVMIREQRNVTHSFPKRWLHQRDNVDAVIKVLSEFSLADCFFQIQIRGEDHANVDLVSLIPPDRFEFAILQNSQQLDLQARGSGTDFVEEDRTTVGLQEFPLLVVRGSRERAGNVSKQFAFQQ